MSEKSAVEQTGLQRFFPGGVGRLRCPVQRYPWGRPAEVSLVARLGGLSGGGEPCAELWMGAHPKASAELVSSEGALSLAAAVALAPAEILGPTVAQRWGGMLPFLFKVLSIGAPLSIQAHPDSTLAAALHSRDPVNYPDPFHKPEIGVALTTVEMLGGLLPQSALGERLAEYPELAALIGAGRCHTRAAYQAVLEASDQNHGEAITQLQRRLTEKGEGCSVAERYFLRMVAEYGPFDRGLCGFFLLNLVTLAPGEGVFMGPHFPHAYLSGDLIECMANSDNVVRAGLTRKFQDRETLIAMLDETAGSPTILKPHEHSVEPGRVRFAPVAEFSLERCQADGATFEFSQPPSLAVLVVLEGEVRVRTALGEQLLRGGEVGAIPAFARNYHLDVHRGDVFVAAVP